MSLFFFSTWGAVLAQEGEMTRVSGEGFPLSVEVPADWEVFKTNPKDSSEVLFFQTPGGAPYSATVSISAHPAGGEWTEIVKRQDYHLLVWEGVPLSVDEELRLKGARGHKWVFNDRGPDGESKVYYRLYLMLPPAVAAKRLLLLEGAAPAENSPEVIPLFNTMARSLAWGLQLENAQP